LRILQLDDVAESLFYFTAAARQLFVIGLIESIAARNGFGKLQELVAFRLDYCARHEVGRHPTLRTFIPVIVNVEDRGLDRGRRRQSIELHVAIGFEEQVELARRALQELESTKAKSALGPGPEPVDVVASGIGPSTILVSAIGAGVVCAAGASAFFRSGSLTRG